MREIEPGVHRLDSDETDDFEARTEEVRAMVEKISNEQRERLDAAHPEYVWWADVVFALRDIKSVCTLLALNGELQVSQVISGVVGRTTDRLLMHVFDNDEAKVRELLEEMRAESEVLDGVVSKAIAEFSGVKEQ